MSSFILYMFSFFPSNGATGLATFRLCHLSLVSGYTTTGYFEQYGGCLPSRNVIIISKRDGLDANNHITLLDLTGECHTVQWQCT